MVTIKDLKKFAAFKGLEDAELAAIAHLCRERRFGEGAVCFVQGKRAMELHLCRSGKVDIVVEIAGDSGEMEVVVHTSGPGEVFGWSAVVGPHKYTASARCVEKTEDITIRGSQLLDLFEENPRVGYRVMKNLSSAVSSRLAETREKLTTLIADRAGSKAPRSRGKQAKRRSP
jgi:CRP/FNR family cyclic AMP-dependent transcriptional regulator